MKPDEWREHVLRILRRRNRYQFGQPAHTCSLVEQSGCTDTCIQMIVQLVKGKNVSLNDVRRRSGAPQDTPMNTTEALRALHSYGLPYEISNDLTAAGVMRVARTKGPVIVCEMYWSHPQWAGYTYMGRTLHGVANGVHVGVAMPTKHAGLTQWTFTDGHAILAAADDWSEGVHLGVIRDPNHNSPSRPERPAYDLVTTGQLNRMLNSFKSKYGYKVMLVPTRPIIRRAR